MSSYKNLSGVILSDELSEEVTEAVEKGGALPDYLAEIFALVQTPYTGPDGKPLWVLRLA